MIVMVLNCPQRNRHKKTADWLGGFGWLGFEGVLTRVLASCF